MLLETLSAGWREPMNQILLTFNPCEPNLGTCYTHTHKHAHTDRRSHTLTPGHTHTNTRTQTHTQRPRTTCANHIGAVSRKQITYIYLFIYHVFVR